MQREPELAEQERQEAKAQEQERLLTCEPGLEPER